VPDDVKLADLGVALDHLRSLPEVTGKVATMGYCLGGTLAYRAACHFGADACVSYYGSGVADLVAAGQVPPCPSILHFGGSDAFIPQDQIDAVQAGAGLPPDIEIHVQVGAGHAFENFLAPQFSDPDAAAVSWPLTTDFLLRTLGG
jgi:carboxymethylenebutenolidase